MKNKKADYVNGKLKKVFDAILGGRFGDISFIKEYITNMINNNDYYLVCHDFYEFADSQEKVDSTYKNSNEWQKKCIQSICRMGFFSSDRSIEDYAKRIWKLEKLEVPKPSIQKENRVISSLDLKSMESESDKK